MQFHIYRNFVKFVWKNKKSHGHVSCQRLHCICGWTSSHLSAFPDLSTCVCFFWTRFICSIYLFLIHNWTRVFFFVLCLVLHWECSSKNGRLKKEAFCFAAAFCLKDVKHPKLRDRTNTQEEIFGDVFMFLGAWTSLCVGLLTCNCRETCQRVCVCNHERKKPCEKPTDCWLVYPHTHTHTQYWPSKLNIDGYVAP